MIVVFAESPQTLPGVEVKINYSYAESLLFVCLKGCSQQVEVKSGKTKENGISHLRKTALSYQPSTVLSRILCLRGKPILKKCFRTAQRREKFFRPSKGVREHAALENFEEIVFRIG